MPLTFPPYYAESGAGWRLAGSLIQFATEVHAANPAFTCLGTKGDAAHGAEGYGSDHNPFIVYPAGMGVVRAIDIGGPDALLKQLRQHLWGLYAAQDDRLYQFGYAKGCSDNLINNWGLPFGTHVDTGDAGHLHLSVTQRDGNHPSPSGYVPAIDDRRTWGISTIASAPTTPTSPAPTSAASAPVYPFSPPDHFGDIKGDKHSHGGDTRYDNATIVSDIKWIQSRLNTLGFGPLAVDGQFGPQTIAAVTAFQHKYRPTGTTLWGQVWGDDWHTLATVN